MDELERLNKRGYFVRENVFVYHSIDMDKTLKWFKDVLGWYGDVIDRGADGVGEYGFACDMPKELVASHGVPFRGVHLWRGEPVCKTLALIQVSSVQALYEHVKKNGWTRMSDIHATGARPKTRDITTPDGCVLTFFE